MKTVAGALGSFVVLAYAITWILLAPWFYVYNVVYDESIPAWMWGFVPFAFLGGWGPSVAALIAPAAATPSALWWRPYANGEFRGTGTG